jgi:succinate-acetate transporter protein
MTTVDATADESGRSGTLTQEAAAPPAAVVGPMAGDPAMLGLGTFIVGAVSLGLALVGVVPAGVLGAPLAVILAATALGLLMATVWCAALGQSAVAAVFGIFGTFWLSYAVLVLGLDHNWFAIGATAILATVKLFLIAWLVLVLMLTLATLRLPSAFSVLFGLVALALLLLLLAYAGASAAGVPSAGLIKTAGYVVLLFAALGGYLFFGAASAGTASRSCAVRDRPGTGRVRPAPAPLPGCPSRLIFRTDPGYSSPETPRAGMAAWTMRDRSIGRSESDRSQTAAGTMSRWLTSRTDRRPCRPSRAAMASGASRVRQGSPCSVDTCPTRSA